MPFPRRHFNPKATPASTRDGCFDSIRSSLPLPLFAALSYCFEDYAPDDIGQHRAEKMPKSSSKACIYTRDPNLRSSSFLTKNCWRQIGGNKENMKKKKNTQCSPRNLCSLSGTAKVRSFEFSLQLLCKHTFFLIQRNMTLTTLFDGTFGQCFCND